VRDKAARRAGPDRAAPCRARGGIGLTGAAAARFVLTAAIQQAIVGRETDVLDALGVDWRAGRPHIPCPYPEHGDENASWRSDKRHGKARCTCATGDNIFAVVMKIEGINFEEAKLRIAELLKLDDLIRTKEVNGQKFQATDATSLLSASVDRRNDALPVAYLAYRLGVSLDAVPIPRTPMFGLKGLGYYDQPAFGSKAKPKLVGEFPCAVFGTIDSDGCTHAHRIYLKAGGAGKAELGTLPDGRSRDPKKSAKLTGNDNTAGRSVIWGDPNLSPHIFVTEGIETGAAIALVLAVQIDSGEIAVAAAISATGVGAFRPYPATRRITVAADRDEAPKSDGRSGSRRRERAARTLGLKCFDRIEVNIALPGAPGQTVDWLEVLVKEGSGAVRAGISVGVAFLPTAAEIEALEQERGRAAELKEIAAVYPLPAMDTMTLTYQHTATGKVKVHKLADGKMKFEAASTEPMLVPIATPFGVLARLRHADQADAYGLRCVVQDMNGKPRAIDFDRATLAKMAAAEIRSMLFVAGLRTEVDGEMVAVQSLKAADPEREIVVVRRAGWQEIPGCPYPIFVTPGGTVIGAPDWLDLELSASARMSSEVAQRGSLEGWRSAIRAAVSVRGCEHWTLGILAAFAGPIVALTGLDTCGINLSGMTTSGKSAAQRLAASAWSSPDIHRPGLFQSARATDNSLEGLAQRSTGTVLALDELAHVSGKLAGKMIYTIAGGVGKRRMNADASLRDSYAWATFAILSGECSLEEKVRGDGGEWLAGMSVRIVDIDVTGVNRNVGADTLRQIDEIEQHYGHAGPAFVHALTGHELHLKAPTLRNRVLSSARAIAGGETMDSAMIRAATPLALLMIAGELAKMFSLIPPEAAVPEAVRWAWERFTKSSDAAALDPETRVIMSLRGWIAERWDVTIKSVDAQTGINNREAVAWYDNSAVYIPKARIREASGNALKESQIGAALDHRGLLAARPEDDRFYVRWVPKIGRIAAYALRRSEFGHSENAADPDVFSVHRGERNG
jgi:hypothetical protein